MTFTAIARTDLFAVYLQGRVLAIVGVDDAGKAIVVTEKGDAKRATSVHGFQGVEAR